EDSRPTPWFDEQWITLRRAQSLAVLGEPHRAAQSFLGTIGDLPARYRRGRGVWLARTSRALAGDRQVEHAATLGLDALAIGTETRSARILTELARLNDYLAPYPTVPAVADFHTAMKDTVRRQA
ncbi:MAG: DNA-binding protein, partial [Actinobacteria bacterium]|nr:DNA-binding protein [Actinomycetota bacterium]